MRRKIFLVVTMAVAAMAAGCSSTPEPKVSKAYVNPAIDGAPAWVLDPSSAGAEGITAVGSAEKSRGGIQFQRNEAMGNGRDELARMLSIRVKNSLENFNRQTGVAEDQSFDKVTAGVSKQIANETLNGSRQKDLWIAADGTMHVLMILDAKVAAEAAKKAVVSSLKKEDAKWQQAESRKALEALEASIDKEFGK